MNGKARDDFEVWASAEHMNLAVCHGSQTDVVYLMAETNFTWRAWKASRESLAIELPEHYCYDSPGEAYPVIQDCREAIEAAGLKVAL